MGSSGGVYGDTQIPIAQRATRLLLDVLASVHETILDYVVTADLDLATLGPILDRLAEAITELEVVGEVKRELKSSVHSDENSSTGLKLTLSSKPGFEASSNDENKTSSESENRLEESGQLTYRGILAVSTKHSPNW